MSEPKNHWQFGKLSGYHSCCVVWFYIRMWCYIKTGLYLIRGSRVRMLRRDESDNKTLENVPQHVLCPFHQIFHKLGFFKLRYFSCEECGWHQLGDGPCSVEVDHEGWITGRIKNAPSYMILPGRIAERVRSERGDEQTKTVRY